MDCESSCTSSGVCVWCGCRLCIIDYCTQISNSFLEIKYRYCPNRITNCPTPHLGASRCHPLFSEGHALFCHLMTRNTSCSDTCTCVQLMSVRVCVHTCVCMRVDMRWPFKGFLLPLTVYAVSPIKLMSPSPSSLSLSPLPPTLSSTNYRLKGWAYANEACTIASTTIINISCSLYNCKDVY